jgi:hypothetical protein
MRKSFADWQLELAIGKWYLINRPTESNCG